MQRTIVREAWADWVTALGDWHLFGTLTYRETPGRGKPHPEAVERHVQRWLQAAPKILGRPVEAAVVGVERHRSSWPHAHAVLRLPGGVQKHDLVALGQAWYLPHGYAKLELPKSRNDVVAYVCKYVTKDLEQGNVILWPRRGRMSDHQPGLPS
jgi:hypothetical protein